MNSTIPKSNPFFALRELDRKLLPPRHHSRLWGRGRSRAAGKRRGQRKALKRARELYKVIAHASNYGMFYPWVGGW